MRPRLRSFELAWTDAAFDAIYPEPLPGVPAGGSASTLPHGVASMHPARFFDGVLASIPLEQSVGLRLTLWMIALAPLFTIRRLGTIASIRESDRVRVLTALIASRIYVVRQLAMSFKAVATLLYAKSDAVRAAMQTPAVVSVRSGEGGLVSATRLASKRAAVGGTHDHAAE